MINVIHAGSAGFDALVYPEQSPVNQMYLLNQVSTFNNTLNDIGRRFMETGREIYDKINSSEAMALARSAIRVAAGILHPNVVRPLTMLEELQGAQPVMQQWMMACPDIRQLYHEQRCDGFSETYIDRCPGKIGEEHYDYRRVMDGILSEDKDGFSHTHYVEDLMADDRDLDFDEQTTILKTWDVMRMFIQKGQDPTSVFGGSL